MRGVAARGDRVSVIQDRDKGTFFFEIRIYIPRAYN
jgi:hypothetical protein